jgi:hypothetical protein
MNRKFIFSILLVCLLAFVAVFTFGCSGGNSLSGTWVSEHTPQNWISFSGKKFSYGFYPKGDGYTWLDNRQNQATDGTYSISGDRIEMSFSAGEVKLYPFSRTSEYEIRINSWTFRRKN